MQATVYDCCGALSGITDMQRNEYVHPEIPRLLRQVAVNGAGGRRAAAQHAIAQTAGGGGGSGASAGNMRPSSGRASRTAEGRLPDPSDLFSLPRYLGLLP